MYLKNKVKKHIYSSDISHLYTTLKASLIQQDIFYIEIFKYYI